MVQYIIIGVVAASLAAIAVLKRHMDVENDNAEYQQREDNQQSSIILNLQSMNKMINEPSVTTALANLCYIINRLADNSNICKSIAIALTGVFVGLSKDPSNGQFWFVFILIWILGFNDSLYIGLKINLQQVSDNLSAAAVKNDGTLVNPFSLNDLRKLKITQDSHRHSQNQTRINSSSAEGEASEQSNHRSNKFFRDLKTASIGFRTITTLPFYLVLLGGLLIYQYGDSLMPIASNCCGCCCCQP